MYNVKCKYNKRVNGKKSFNAYYAFVKTSIDYMVTGVRKTYDKNLFNTYNVNKILRTYQ
jgi:hypothetical protein